MIVALFSAIRRTAIAEIGATITLGLNLGES
jgi:hypothetical protein